MLEQMKNLMVCLGLYDIILVSVKESTLYMLRTLGIPYILCYPDGSEETYKEWGRRNTERRTQWLWDRVHNIWEKMINRLRSDTHCSYRVELKSNEYLSDYIEDIVI